MKTAYSAILIALIAITGPSASGAAIAASPSPKAATETLLKVSDKRPFGSPAPEINRTVAPAPTAATAPETGAILVGLGIMVAIALRRKSKGF